MPTALPVLTEVPNINHVEGLNLSISWDPWNRSRDYGAGHVEAYKVQCWESNNRTNEVYATASKDQQLLIITLSKPDTAYECGVSVLQIVSGDTIAGPVGPTITERTECLGNQH